MGLLDRVFPWLGHGRYSSSPTPVTEGQVVALRCTPTGELLVSGDGGGGSPDPWIKDTTATLLRWNMGARSSAVIQGWKGATVASMTGSESVTIKRAGGSPTTVNFSGGDTTFALCAAKINATFSGLAAGDSNGVVLTDPTSVEVTANSGFAKHGIPVMKRAVADTNLSAVTVPVQNDVGFLDIEHVSKAVTVPAGCNAVTLDITLDNPISAVSGVKLAFIWQFPGLAPPVTRMTGYPILGVVDGTVAVAGVDQLGGTQGGRAANLNLVADLPSSSFTRTFVLPVPPAKTLLRVAVFGSYVEGTQGPPSTPPELSIVAGFGAR